MGTHDVSSKLLLSLLLGFLPASASTDCPETTADIRAGKRMRFSHSSILLYDWPDARYYRRFVRPEI